jgi:hypothetical protein
MMKNGWETLRVRDLERWYNGEILTEGDGCHSFSMSPRDCIRGRGKSSQAEHTILTSRSAHLEDEAQSGNTRSGGSREAACRDLEEGRWFPPHCPRQQGIASAGEADLSRPRRLTSLLDPRILKIKHGWGTLRVRDLERWYNGEILKEGG